MATPSASAEPVLSTAEVIDRIRNLSVSDALKFKKSSEYLSYSGGRPPEELRNEAIRRAVQGTRKCPRNIDLVVFLYGVMRSIVSADRKARLRSPNLAVVPRHYSAQTSLLDGVDPRLSPEDQLIQNE